MVHKYLLMKTDGFFPLFLCDVLNYNHEYSVAVNETPIKSCSDQENNLCVHQKYRILIGDT